MPSVATMSMQTRLSKISTQTGLTHEQIRQVIDAYHDTIVAELAERGTTSIRGFGRYYVQEHPARKSWDIQRQCAVQVGPSKRAHFRPSKFVSEALGLGGTYQDEMPAKKTSRRAKAAR